MVESPSNSGRHLAVASLVFVAAMVLGWLDLRAFERAEPLSDAPYGDSLVYFDEAARQFGPDGEPEAFYKPPVYTALVAAFDGSSRAGAANLRALQLILGALTAAFVFGLAAARAGVLAGLLAAALWLAYAPVAFFQTKLLDSTVSLFLTTAAFVVADRLLRRGGGVALGALTGVLFGIASCARAANLVFLLIAFARFEGTDQRSARRARVALVLGALLPVLGVTARNAAVSGDAIPINYSEGHTFLVGNNPKARGMYNLPPGYPDGVGHERATERHRAQAALGRAPSPAEQRDHSYREGLRYLRESGGHVVGLWLDKLRFAVSSLTLSDNYSMWRERERFGLLAGRSLTFPMLLALGLAGLFLAGARPRVVLALPVAVTMGLLLVFYVSERYRLPAAPFLAAAGGVALAALFDGATRRRAAIAVAVGAASLFAFAHARALPFAEADLHRSERFFDVVLDLHAGRSLAEQGDLAAAARSMARSISDHPGLTDAEAEFLALLHGRTEGEVASIAVVAREVAPGHPRIEAMLRVAGAPAIEPAGR